jgi:hypothetical protein
MSYCDNQSVIEVVENLVGHDMINHVELHSHYLRQLVEDNVVTPFYSRINDHVVDIFMNPLSQDKFIKLHDAGASGSKY